MLLSNGEGQTTREHDSHCIATLLLATRSFVCRRNPRRLRLVTSRSSIRSNVYDANYTSRSFETKHQMSPQVNRPRPRRHRRRGTRREFDRHRRVKRSCSTMTTDQAEGMPATRTSASHRSTWLYRGATRWVARGWKTPRPRRAAASRAEVCRREHLRRLCRGPYRIKRGASDDSVAAAAASGRLGTTSPRCKQFRRQRRSTCELTFDGRRIFRMDGDSMSPV